MKNRIIYLAAGNSIRYGSNKLLEIIGGKPLYRQCLDELLDIVQVNEDYSIIVVTQYEEISAYVNGLNADRVNAIINPDSRLGISYSIKAGIRALPKEEGYDTFIVADQPKLKGETIDGFMKAVMESGMAVGCVCCGSRLGNPTMFRTALEAELMTLTGDTGGKKIIKAHADDCFMYEVAGEELWDIDFREDSV